MTSNSAASWASFRDPAGFIFQEDGRIKRAVSLQGKEDYDLLMESGLYDALTERGWLIPHTEAQSPTPDHCYKILTPENIPVWTYPYEWCFSQLKEAAIITLEIQLLALQHGLSLKDGTPFNVQFLNNRPIHIDTLSFERFDEHPWVAYKQFCETFLAPLALMAEVQADLIKLLSIYPAGVPLPMAARLLPFRTWMRSGYFGHIHLHALSQSYFEDGTSEKKRERTLSARPFSKFRMTALADHLLSSVKKITLAPPKAAFSNYYETQTYYSEKASNFKAETLERWAGSGSWKLALDIGGNDGKYARILTKMGILTICADSNPYCVEQNYVESRESPLMIPLLLDLANPTPDSGWANEERSSIFKRVKPDLLLCLALIHHLRITAGIPFRLLAEFFSRITPCLLIEFVPKTDPGVRALLQNRTDIFFDYDVANFESQFGQFFRIEQRAAIPTTERILYFLKTK